MSIETSRLIDQTAGRACFLDFNQACIDLKHPDLPKHGKVLALHKNDSLAVVMDKTNPPGRIHFMQRDGKGGWKDCISIFLGEMSYSFWIQRSVIFSQDGHVLMVGDPNNNTMGEQAGAVYVLSFEKETRTWLIDKVLYEATPSPYSHFGETVSTNIPGNLALVGTFRNPSVNDMADNTHVFAKRGGTWHSQHKINGTELVPNDKAVKIAYPWI